MASTSSRTPDGSYGLERVLRRSPAVRAILDGAPTLGLPQWYFGAGGIAQTMWNHLHGFEPTYGVKDFDLVYFDPSDMSETGEAGAAQRANERFGDLGVELDITNEARVHLWYQDRFGVPMAAYTSSEDAIGTWPTTASSVGVRYDGDRFVVCAPFGLSDLFDMIVRPNKRLVTREVYEDKVRRWTAHWPKLTIVAW